MVRVGRFQAMAKVWEGNPGLGKGQSHLEERLEKGHGLHRASLVTAGFCSCTSSPRLITGKAGPFRGPPAPSLITPTPLLLSVGHLLHPLHLFQNSAGNSVSSCPDFLRRSPYFLENTPQDGVGGAMCRLMLPLW